MDAKSLYAKFLVLKWVYAPYQDRRTLAFRLLALFGGIYVLGIVVTWLDGTLYLRGRELLGYIEDPVNPFYMLALAISTYLVHSLIRRFSLAFLGAENGLNPQGGILQSIDLRGQTLKAYEDTLQKIHDFISLKRQSARRWFLSLRVVALLLFIAGGLYEPLLTEETRSNWNFLFYPFRPNLSHIVQYPASFTFNAVKDAVVYVVIIPELAWFTLSIAVATMVILRRLQRDQTLVILPLSPDKAGGLKSTGEISLVLFYIVIIQLLHIFPTSMIFHWPLFHQLIYLPFFLFATFVFFAPLFVVRRSMKDAKRLELEKTMAEFHGLHKSLVRLDVLKKQDRNEIESLSRMIELNNERYRRSATMAVWPYDIGTFLRFITGIAIPMMFYVLQMLLQNSGWLQNPETIMELFVW